MLYSDISSEEDEITQFSKDEQFLSESNSEIVCVMI